MQKSSTNPKRTQMVLRNKKILKNAQPNTDIVIYAYLSVSLKRASYNYWLHCLIMLAIIKEESFIALGKKKASSANDR